ncbi:MAG: ferrous iron transporter B [Agathobacter sp.]|nr:ferrous iron transporter B [Agathobacter sp.]
MSVKIALAGNPNSGKTTLFNALTGSNQFVGNWPGVTVEKKEGKLKGHKDVIIIDLPGIYSLSPYTLEEVVARNYLIGERPDAIINIVDGTNIERNLYLSTQLMELGIPVVMAVNMMDILEKTGDKIHVDKLSKKLGCEVIEISALKGTGIQKAAEKAVALAQKKAVSTPVHTFSEKAEEIISVVDDKLEGIVSEEQKRFFAIKLLEKDDKIAGQMKSVPEVSNEIKQMEEAFDDDTESIITNERYVYISSIIGDCVTKAKKEKLTTSDKIDRIVTNRWAALPIFALIAGAFFDNAGWVSWSAYFIGVAAIICSGIILKKTKMFAGDPAPFVMELPAYHWPTVSNVLRSMWERGWSFIKKAGTIILLSTIVLWFLMSFGWTDGGFGMLEAEQLDESILAAIGNAIAWIFAPLGWTQAGEGWKMAVAAVTGLIAKENVVATFGLLFGFAEVAEDGAEIWGSLASVMTEVAAYGFLVFNLLCAPCFAAMGAIKREMNNAKWFWFAIGYQCVLAYVVALCIYQIGTLITTGAFGVGTVVALLLIIGLLYLLFRPYKERR